MTDESSECDVVQSRAISAFFPSILTPNKTKYVEEESKMNLDISIRADTYKMSKLERQYTKVFVNTPRTREMSR